MKKQLRWLALLLSLALLCGCSWQPFGGADGTQALDIIRHPSIKPFPEMEYARPDADLLRKTLAQAQALAEAGQEEDALFAAIADASMYYNAFLTMDDIACIRADADLTDQYYAEEYAYCEQLSSQVEQWKEQMLTACALSELRPALERAGYFDAHMLDYYETSDDYNDELVLLYQRESKLLSDYRALCADAIMGQEDALPEQTPDSAYLHNLRTVNERAAELYCELLAVREEIAQASGYDSYEQYQFDSYGRDYTPAEVAGFLDDIRSQLGSYYAKLLAGGAYRSLTYPQLSEQALLSCLRTVTQTLGEPADEAYSFMERYQLYDVTSSEAKAETSYTTYLTSYNAPYLFVNTFGDVEDVTYTAHEFGHFLVAYQLESGSGSLDMDETFAQGMEWIMLNHTQSLLGEDSYEALKRIKLLDLLETYCVQGAFAAFEQAAYQLPAAERSAETLNKLALSCQQDFGCVVEGDEEMASLWWTQISHLFEAPFYVLSYCISADAAVQLYAQALRAPDEGWQTYCRLMEEPNDDGYLSALESVGLESPLAEGRAGKALALLKAQLPPDDPS